MIGLTIRMNAARNDLTTDDGKVIDRSKMSQSDSRKVARMVRDIWASAQEKAAAA